MKFSWSRQVSSGCSPPFARIHVGLPDGKVAIIAVLGNTRIVRSHRQMIPGIWLRGPQLGADRGFESCHDFAGVIGDLCVSQGGFAALKS